MITIEEKYEPDQNWNKRVLESELATIYQTKEIGIIYEKQNLVPKFITFIDNKGKISGQLLVFESSRFEKSGFKGKILKKAPGIKKSTYKWSYGPIILNYNFSSEIYDALGKFLIKKKCKVSGVTHPFFQNNISAIGKNFNLLPWSTYMIDLRKSKDELYNNIKKNSGRKNIERSIDRGVKIEEINESSLVDYYNLQNTTVDEFGPEKNAKFKELKERWNLLKPLGYSGFIAKKDGNTIGGLLFSFVNKHIIEGGVARSQEDFKQKFYSQDLIKWRIIEWGLNNKMKYYNLAGFNPKPKNEKEKGIFRYKEKWGGERQNYTIIKR